MATAEHGGRAQHRRSHVSFCLRIQDATLSPSSTLSMPSRDSIPERHEEGWSEKGILSFQGVEGDRGHKRKRF